MTKNDHSPNPLKEQLNLHLGETATRVLLNDCIDCGKLDVGKIVDMPSLTAFKDRVDKVLDDLGMQKFPS
jgi:hypothetical protein